MVRKLIEGKELQILLDSFGIDSGKLGNDLIYEMANRIIAKNVVQLPYSRIPLLGHKELNDRKENFVVSGLLNIINSDSSNATNYVLGMNLDDVISLVQGDKLVRFAGGKKLNYQEAMDELLIGIDTEAEDIMDQYEPIMQRYRAVGKIKSPEGKLKEYRKIMDLDPAHSFAKLYGAGILMQQLEYEEAEDLLLDVFELRPRDPKVLNQLGVLYDRLQEHNQLAEKFYRKAIEIDPTSTKALYNLGLHLEKKGKSDEAIGYFRVAAARGDNPSRNKLTK